MALAIPWVIGFALLPIRGGHVSVGWTLFAVVVDVILGCLAWMKPFGIATGLIVLRLAAGSAVSFALSSDPFVLAFATADAVLVVLVVSLVIAMRGDLLQERAEVTELARTMDSFTRREARLELRQQRRTQRKIEKHGYL